MCGGALYAALFDHAPLSDKKPFRGCYIKPDLLLSYKAGEDALTESAFPLMQN